MASKGKLFLSGKGCLDLPVQGFPTGFDVVFSGSRPSLGGCGAPSEDLLTAEFTVIDSNYFLSISWSISGEPRYVDWSVS